jgi:hypothetical protein
MPIPVIEQVKIQAQILVPLVKTLEAELGRERARDIVRRALGDIYRRLGAEWSKKKDSADVGASLASAFAAYARGDALDYSVQEQSADAYGIDITRCRYAEFFKKIGEPELGFLLVCSADFPFAEGLEPGVELTRTQTIMQGASHCDFRYQRAVSPGQDGDAH